MKKPRYFDFILSVHPVLKKSDKGNMKKPSKAIVIRMRTKLNFKLKSSEYGKLLAGRLAELL